MNDKYFRHIEESGVFYRPIDTKDGKQGWVAELIYKRFIDEKWITYPIIFEGIETKEKADEILESLMQEHIYKFAPINKKKNKDLTACIE